MVYIALFRGINVGGNNKIDMKLLKKVEEQAGMDSVTTYLNIGNIIFKNGSYQSKAEISRILEEAIQANFGLQIKVLIRNLDDIRKTSKFFITTKFLNLCNSHARLLQFYSFRL